MTLQIFQQIKPPQFQTVLMYQSISPNVGVSGQLLVVNQGNVEVNAGNIAANFDNDSDKVRIAIGTGFVVADQNYIAYDTFMPPQHTAQWQEINLSVGQSLFVYSQKGQCSFTFTGSTFDP